VLITNGEWTESQVDECIKNPPDLLSVSLAGINDEEIISRRTGINLDRLWKNISKIYNHRRVVREMDQGISPTIHISTHIYPYEMETRINDIKIFKQKWFEISDAIVIKPTEIIPRLNNTELFINEFQPKYTKNLQYTKIEGTSFVRTAPCFETSRRLSVNSDGDVWCGHFFSEQFGGYLGNVKNQTIREIWHGEKMNEFRKQVRAGIFKRPSCQKCGGEIREFHRNGSQNIEQKINFSSDIKNI